VPRIQIFVNTLLASPLSFTSQSFPYKNQTLVVMSKYVHVPW